MEIDGRSNDLPPEDLELSEEVRAELDRWLAEYESDPSAVVPWEQVREEMRRRRE